MERDRDLAQNKILVMRLGVLMQKLKDACFDVKSEGIDPFNAVSIFGSVQTHLPDCFVPLPVFLHGDEELVPGQLLRVKDKMLDGRQTVDSGPLANGLKTGMVDSAGKMF